MAKPRIYYAHPISDYGTPLEQQFIQVLEKHGYDVVNPADCQQAFDDYLKTLQPGDNKMQFFVDLCNSCDVCAFSVFDDELQADGVPNVTYRVGAGVVKEVESFWARNAPVHFIIKSPFGITLYHHVTRWQGYDEKNGITYNFTPLDVPQTKALLSATGRYPLPAAKG